MQSKQRSFKIRKEKLRLYKRTEAVKRDFLFRVTPVSCHACFVSRLFVNQCYYSNSRNNCFT